MPASLNATSALPMWGSTSTELDPVGSLADDRADQDRRHVLQQGHLDQGDPGGLDEALLQQEVLGRVAGEREFGRKHQIRAGRGGLGAKSPQGLNVLRETAHDRVHLGQSESDDGHALSLPARVLTGL
jgi:hypothetical protein